MSAERKLNKSTECARIRCAWAQSERAVLYHDREWGMPNVDDQVLFEFIILEGAQAGLSWETILGKRERYREVFAGFDAEKIAKFSPRDVERLLKDPGIVRNRLKVEGAVTSAKVYLKMCEEAGKNPNEKHGVLATHLWSFVNFRVIQGDRKQMKDLPAHTPESDAMSKDLKKRGFKFVGTTICYALMQAVGMVNDHLVDCMCHGPCVAAGKKVWKS